MTTKTVSRAKTKKLITNTLILTSFSLGMNLIGMGFRVFLSQKSGAEGMGLLQLVLSVYYMSTNLAAAGVHYAIPRFLAELSAQHKEGQISSFMRRCIGISAAAGVCSAVTLYFFAPLIGKYWLCDSRTVPSLQIIVLGLPFFSIACALRSYFLFRRNTYKPVLGQAAEQFSNMLSVFLLLTLFPTQNKQALCSYSAYGMLIGEAVGCAVILLFYRKERRKSPRNQPTELSYRKILRFSLPISSGSTVRTALTAMENVLIPSGLQKYGLDATASLAFYGKIKGMVLPTLTFPSAFLGAFSMMLVPEIAEAHAQKKEEEIQSFTASVLSLAFSFSAIIFAIFFCYSASLSELLYPGQGLSFFFQCLSPLIPFLYLDGIVDSMLKGMNQQIYGLKINLTDASLRILLLLILLPKLGSYGYLIVIIFSGLFNPFLSIARLIIKCRLRFRIFRWVLFPTGCAFLSCRIAMRLPLPVLLQCAVSIVIYALLLFLPKKAQKKRVGS